MEPEKVNVFCRYCIDKCAGRAGIDSHICWHVVICVQFTEIAQLLRNTYKNNSNNNNRNNSNKNKKHNLT